MSSQDLPPRSRRDDDNAPIQALRGIALVVAATAVTVAAGWLVAVVVAWVY